MQIKSQFPDEFGFLLLIRGCMLVPLNELQMIAINSSRSRSVSCRRRPHEFLTQKYVAFPPSPSAAAAAFKGLYHSGRLPNTALSAKQWPPLTPPQSVTPFHRMADR